MRSARDIQAYFESIFSKMTNKYDRPLNISYALPVLCDILYHQNTEQYRNNRYEFVGESATSFAINLILVKYYPQLSNDNLSALVKKFSALKRLHKAINQEIHLKDYVSASRLSSTLNSIIGVLYSYYGIDVVAKFIKHAVIHVASLELQESIEKTNENPIYLLQQIVKSKNGIFDSSSSSVNGLWRVGVICKLTESSILFSHARVGQSKQQAKTDATQDILNYLSTHSVELNMPAAIPGVYVLPIGHNTYRVSPAYSPSPEINNTSDIMEETDDSGTETQMMSDSPDRKRSRIPEPSVKEEEDYKKMLHELLHGEY